MSKRKKSYDRPDYENNHYNNRVLDGNPINTNFNPYVFNKGFPNGIQDLYSNNFNMNNMLEVLNNIDFSNLNNLFSFLSNGFDINNNFTLDNDINNNIYDKNRNEVVINLFNALKPLLDSELGIIIDKFIEFYMEELNNEK